MMVLLFVLLAGFSIVTWKLAVIQIKESPRLAGLAAQKYQRHITLPAHRGTIRDYNDDFLAFDEAFSELYTDRAHLREIVTVRHRLATLRGVKAIEIRETMTDAETLAAYHDHVATKLAPVLALPKDEVLTKLTADKGEVILERLIEDERAEQIAEVLKKERLFGVYLRPVVERTFPAKDRISLFIGDTDTKTNHGLWGVEKLMDGMLAGVPGEQFIERDRSGNELPAYRGKVIEPRNGHDIHLTIDMQLQDIVEGICEREWKSHQAKRVVIVVTDPFTGSILAAAARPHRDSENPDQSTWTNHVYGGLYEPGSTFKIVTLAAALDQKKVTPTEIIDCEDWHWFEPKLKVWINDDESNGRQTVKGVLVHSSNIGTYKIFKRIGRDSLLDYAKRFGFGQRTGIGLSGEQPGLLPMGKWSNPTQKNVCVGYNLNTTPLHVALAYGAVANGGTLMQARIIDRITTPEGKVEHVPPQPVGQACTAATAAHLRDFLEGVVLEGTGKRASLAPEIRVAGKTGTSVRYDEKLRAYIKNHYVTSFAGFAPVEKPQVTCVVMLDDPVAKDHHDVRGGKVASPIFAEVVRETLHHLATRHQKRMNLAQEGGAK